MSHDRFKNEPIALVGMACRFSGSATSPESLWDMLSKGSTGWTKTASHRFNLNAFLHPKADNKGTVSWQPCRYYANGPLTCDSSTQKDSTSSNKTRLCSTTTSSASVAWRPRQWTLSNGSCWKLPMRLSKMQATLWNNSRARRQESGARFPTRTTNRSLPETPTSLQGEWFMVVLA